jgi:phospholipase C
MRVRDASSILLLLLFAAALSACSHGSFNTSPLPSSPSLGETGGKIKHIIFVVQENRTFDSIFGGPQGFPGADTASSGKASDGSSIALGKVELECTYFDVFKCARQDPNNYHQYFLQACDPSTSPPFAPGTAPLPCRMDGFDKNDPSNSFDTNLPYSYVDYAETKPYWDIAKAYTLGDAFFMSHNSESYTAHQYIFSGQSNNVTNEPVFTFTPDALLGFLYPWGCDSPSGTTTVMLTPSGGETPSPDFPCFSYKSLADLANAARVSWREYSYSICQNINGLDVNRSIRYDSGLWPADEESWCPFAGNVSTANFRTPETTFLSDVQNGDLANVTWVIPGPVTSDHPGVPSGYCGPTWVANIVNAVGKSKFWNDTAIFIFWDDWGGFYDHVPPYVVRDQAGPGFRVPLIVVSPYAKRGHVAHTPGEFGTLLKFTEDTFHLGSLGGTDASPYIGNMDDYFNWNNAQPFVSIAPSNYKVCNAPAALNSALTPAVSRWARMIDDDD